MKNNDRGLLVGVKLKRKKEKKDSKGGGDSSGYKVLSLPARMRTQVWFPEAIFQEAMNSEYTVCKESIKKKKPDIVVRTCNLISTKAEAWGCQELTVQPT